MFFSLPAQKVKEPKAGANVKEFVPLFQTMSPFFF
jgi:hypothetical protein